MATCLYEIALINLTKLEIVICQRIVLSAIENFLKNINNLKQFKLKDCLKVDQDRNNLYKLLKTIFLG